MTKISNIPVPQLKPTLIRKRIKARGLAETDFIRKCINLAPKGMAPTQQHITKILSGGSKGNTGARYLSLFATVLHCKIDSFFEI